MGAKIGVLLNCGQQSKFSKVRREFDAGRVNLDPPMTCADWPVPGNLTLLHTQTAYTLKPWHQHCQLIEHNLMPYRTSMHTPKSTKTCRRGHHQVRAFPEVTRVTSGLWRKWRANIMVWRSVEKTVLFPMSEKTWLRGRRKRSGHCLNMHR